jgi:dephospho-CoA kinase
MIKVGITGGVGSGKSVVSELLRLNGIPVYNSDSEAKRLMQTLANVRRLLINLLGEEAYVGKSLNRSYIANLVFGNVELLGRLNAIVHPAVRSDFNEWAVNQHSDIVVVESAILFESGLSPHLDKVIAVTAPLETRIARVVKRDSLSKEQILQRILSQMSEEERLRLSDFVVINDENQLLIPQITAILNDLRRS